MNATDAAGALRTRRLRRPLVLLAAVLVTGLVAGSLGSAGASAVAATADEPAAVALLRGAEAAAQRLGWTGTQYVIVEGMAGSAASVVEVRHLAGQGTIARSRGASGADATAASFSTDETVGNRSFAPGELDRLLATYTVVSLPDEPVAGRDAAVVGVRRQDGTWAGRLWVDRRSGLPLRREVYDGRGQVARSSALLDVDIEPHGVRGAAGGFVGHLPPSEPQPVSAGFAVSLAAARAAGWQVPERIGGTLVPVDAATMPGGVLRLTYSDGLSTISLFQQRGRLAAAPAGTTPHRLGAATVHVGGDLPTRLSWEGGGTVFTVVGEAPQDVMTAAVSGLAHDGPPRAEDGMLQRLWRGATRVSAWLNPFD